MKAWLKGGIIGGIIVLSVVLLFAESYLLSTIFYNIFLIFLISFVLIRWNQSSFALRTGLVFMLLNFIIGNPLFMEIYYYLNIRYFSLFIVPLAKLFPSLHEMGLVFVKVLGLGILALIIGLIIGLITTKLRQINNGNS